MLGAAESATRISNYPYSSVFTGIFPQYSLLTTEAAAGILPETVDAGLPHFAYRHSNLMKRIFISLLLILSLAAHAEASVGQLAPAFTLSDQHGQSRSSEQFRGKWLVLYFYPKADTPGCTEEACSFRDDIVLLRALGAEVVGISTDSLAAIRNFGQKHELPFTLLADPNGQVSARYGALLDLGIMKFAKRHTFLIDPTGRITKRYTDVDTKTYAKTLLTDLRALLGKN